MAPRQAFLIITQAKALDVGPHVNKRKLLGLVCMLVFIGSIYYLTLSPLPALSDIESIQVKYQDQRRGMPTQFELQPPYWKPLWSILLPARKDGDPANWPVFVDLEIRLKNGSTSQVTLYQLNEGAGAFSTGGDTNSRTWYRAGNTEMIVDIIMQAYHATVRAKP